MWGAIHGLMLALERWRGKKPLYGPLPHPVRVALTFVVILVTWVFFRSDNFTMAWRYLGVMFAGQGGGNGAAELLTAQLFALPNLIWLGAAAVVVWWVPNSQQLLEKLTVPKVVACLAGFVISLGLMFAQGYSPFLYFQF